jgi:hypothetical protein
MNRPNSFVEYVANKYSNVEALKPKPPFPNLIKKYNTQPSYKFGWNNAFLGDKNGWIYTTPMLGRSKWVKQPDAADTPGMFKLLCIGNRNDEEYLGKIYTWNKSGGGGTIGYDF